MDILITILLFAFGVLLVVKGGDYFVDAASWMAEVSGIPKLIVGATIVSVATTLPEMLVSIMAARQGKVDMSIGNAIGSVTANIGLIMALALVFMPGVIKRSDYLLKSIMMLAAAGTIVACGFSGEVSIPFCILLLVIFAFFLVENITSALHGSTETDPDEDDTPDEAVSKRRMIAINLVKFVVGAIGIVWGADLLVDNGSMLARLFGISERVIGVTLIAVGTSLPELVTTLTAIRKKESDLSVGNILGANIMDLTLIMPLSAIISGSTLPVAATSAIIDLPICLIVGLIAIVPAMIASRFRRWQGFLLLAVYACYVYITCFLVG